MTAAVTLFCITFVRDKERVDFFFWCIFFACQEHIDTVFRKRGTISMSEKISDLQERQIVNSADGKCLGNIKDVEQMCIRDR